MWNNHFWLIIRPTWWIYSFDLSYILWRQLLFWLVCKWTYPFPPLFFRRCSPGHDGYIVVLHQCKIECLPTEKQGRIMSILPANAGLGVDQSVWPGNGNGKFTIYSTYHLISTDVEYGTVKNKNQRLVWLMCHGKLLYN